MIDAKKMAELAFHKCTGFICHSSNHWFTIRKVFGVWFDLNSLAKSPHKLGAEIGYSSRT